MKFECLNTNILIRSTGLGAFLICCLIFRTSAQNGLITPYGFLSKTFTRDDGLPYNHVLDIRQDQTGFLWIATWDGLSRFDGYDFRNYYYKPDDSTSLPFIVVNSVLVDDLNNVWIICNASQLVKYNRAGDCFEWIIPHETKAQTNKYFMKGFDKKNSWYITPSKREWFIYNAEKEHFTNIKIKVDNVPDQGNLWADYEDVCQDNNGGFWFLKWVPERISILKGVWKNDSTITLDPVRPLKVDPARFDEIRGHCDYFDFFSSASGTQWMFSRFGIHALDTVSNQFKPFTGTIIPEEFKGKKYCIWYDENSGAHVVVPGKNRYIVLPAPPGTIYQTVYVDDSDNIWYGTVNESRANMGLTRLTETPRYFHHYLTGTDKEGNLHPVFAITKDSDGDIWAGTRGIGFVYRIKPDGREIKVSFTHLFPGREAPRARSLVSDDDGIWIGCTESTIVHFNKRTGHFRKWILSVKDRDVKDKNLNIHNIVKDKNEIIISGTGVFRFNPTDGTVTRKYSYPLDGAALSFFRERNNGYLAGMTNCTVIRFDSLLNETGRFSIDRYLFFAEHVCRGDSADFWLALMGGGLGHINTHTGKDELLTTADGLSNNTAYSLLKDKKGNLWISTNQGLSRFNPRTRQFRNFGRDEGLLIEEFNSDAWYQAPDGEMFFGGVGGLVSFYPDSITDTESSAQPAPLIITEFLVSGEVRRFNKAIYDLDTLTLMKGDNNFQVTYACADFAHADRIKYRYRLIGVNEEWTETDHRHRYINYTNLRPGEYRLDLEATNPDGLWASRTSLHIEIPFRYYETGWFRLLVVLMAAGFLSLLVFFYIRHIKLQARQKQDELTLESIRGQMNPHFIYNSLNSINYFIMKNDRLSANHYIADFSRLIRSILGNMAEEFIPFDRELQSIHDYLKLEHLRFGDKFNYSVKCDFDENEKELWITPGMVQPFIENAIWHGVRNLENRTGFIRISFVLTEEKGFIRAIIEDTGAGRIRAGRFINELPGKKSRGVAIVTERLRLINRLRRTSYRISMEDLFPDQEESGTRVVVDVPVRI